MRSRYTVTVAWSEEDQAWIARDEGSRITARGGTRYAAVKELFIAIHAAEVLGVSQ
jgi:hypothetical protein